MTIYARLSEDRMTVLCGRQYPTGHWCEEALAHVGGMALESEGPRYLAWTDAWHRYPYPPAEPRELRRTGEKRRLRGYAPTRRGYGRPTLGRDTLGKPLKSFGFDLPAKCPRCLIVNVLDPGRLDVVALP